MIKANELRIGNWLKPIFNGTNPKQEPIQVTGMFIVQCHRLELQEGGPNANHEPISLTPEILEECGFVEDDTFNIQFKGVAKKAVLKLTIPRPDGEPIPNDFELTSLWNIKDHDIGCDYTVNGFWAGIKIKYLHQLQNLYFALTGEELEINMNPV